MILAISENESEYEVDIQKDSQHVCLHITNATRNQKVSLKVCSEILFFFRQQIIFKKYFRNIKYFLKLSM